jgi:hypothetical protein
MRTAFFVQANQSRDVTRRRPIEADATGWRTKPRASCTSAGAGGSVSPGGGEHPQLARTRSTTLTNSVRRDTAVTKRGREHGEDGATGTKWRELALGDSGAVAIPTRPACKLMVGKGGREEDRRCERNKVPGGHAALGTASPADAGPPVYAGSERRCGWPEVRMCGAERRTDKAEAASRNGVLGAVPLGERVGPHASRSGGKDLSRVGISSSCWKNDLRTSLKLPFPYFIAAEFALFQSARKFTLPHLMVGITFAIAGVLAFRFGNALPVWASVPLSLLIGTPSAWWVFRLFLLVLPWLGKLVA